MNDMIVGDGARIDHCLSGQFIVVKLTKKGDALVGIAFSGVKL